MSEIRAKMFKFSQKDGFFCNDIGTLKLTDTMIIYSIDVIVSIDRREQIELMNIKQKGSRSLKP